MATLEEKEKFLLSGEKLRLIKEGKNSGKKSTCFLALDHQNITSLVRFCYEYGEMIIIYDYASNGSFKKYIRNVQNLKWEQRLQNCIDAAQGLNYLHNHHIIHRDAKSPNILLGDRSEGMIGDVGLSITVKNTDYRLSNITPVGTSGYVDPKYLKRGMLSKQSDMYSFGVVLLEMLCGRFVTTSGTLMTYSANRTASSGYTISNKHKTRKGPRWPSTDCSARTNKSHAIERRDLRREDKALASRGTRPLQSASVFSRLRHEKDKPTRQRSPVNATVFTRLGPGDKNVFTRLGERKRGVHLRLGPEDVPQHIHMSRKKSTSRPTKTSSQRRKDARELIRSYVTCSSKRQQEIEEE
nr:protein kinase-like domain-containing protein [Tanacetum cinerariifolium]